MPIRVGFLGVAHMHAWSYVAALQSDCRARVTAVWDPDVKRRDIFALENGVHQSESIEDLFERADAVVIAGPNRAHAEHIELAAAAGKPILCEKPLVTSQDEADRVRRAVEGKVYLMTAFPCRFAPAYLRLKERVLAGDIGPVQAICATNRGKCPFDWFVDPEQSGGGAMIDHTVHVADLFRDLLGAEPTSVLAQTGSNMYGQAWDDTAMLTLEYEGGVFATLDSSWSRPQSYKTWGDVTLNVVGEKGVIEVNLFGQALEVYGHASSLAPYGSNVDVALIDEWLTSIEQGRAPRTGVGDGLAASRVAIAAYESVGRAEPFAV